MSKSEKKERCIPCEHQVAADMALSVCETVGPEKFGLNCRQLRKDTIMGKEDPLEVAKRIRDVAKRKGLKEFDNLDEIYRLGKG